MAFEKTEPTDTTKLRNLGTVIRPNWEAMVTADSTFMPEALNLADRTALGVANDPTALVDSVIAYSKQDGAGKPQAYTIDPDSVISQLTGGSTSSSVNGGTAGGTIKKVVIFVGTTKLILYSGTTGVITSAAGKTVVFPEAYTTIYTAVATANDGNAITVSAIKGPTGLTIRTGNSVIVNWYALGEV